MSEPLLEFDLSKRYPGFELTCSASFGRGITAIFGPSGSGKTTLLECLAGLTSPDRGLISVLGTTVYSDTGRATRPEKRRFGYVFQDAALFPHMSVRDNILYGYSLTAIEERATEPDDLVTLFNLTRLLDRSVANLSGGERQLVALARALAISPRMLLLDEPMVSLDAGFRGVIMQYLKRIRQEIGTPMVLVTHSISEVFALAEDVLVLRDGRRLAQGPPSEMLVHPDVSALADYAIFENILAAQVVGRRDHQQIELRVGGVTLTAPEGRAQPGQAVTVSIRASDIILALEAPTKMSAQNRVQTRVDEVNVLDGRALVYLDIGERLVAEITPGAVRDLDLKPGDEVFAIIKSTSIVVLTGTEPGASSDV